MVVMAVLLTEGFGSATSLLRMLTTSSPISGWSAEAWMTRSQTEDWNIQY